MNKRIVIVGFVGMLAMAGCMTSEKESGQGKSLQARNETDALTAEVEKLRIHGSHDPADYLPHESGDTARAAVDSVALLAFEKANTPEIRKAAAPKSGRASAGSVKLCAGINSAPPCWDLQMNLDYNDLRFEAPLGNDVISSAEVSGASIYLCDANNFGTCYVIDNNVPDFRFFPLNGGTINFNDRVSSFKFQQSDNGNALVFYDSPSYGGSYCLLWSPFDANYPPCNMNDRASSLRFVWPNIGLTKGIALKDVAGFKGSLIYWYMDDTPALQSGIDNKASSFQWLFQ